MSRASMVPNRGTLFGHPKGLFLLFGTELWERMSYYGMRAIFVLYLTQATTAGVMGWSDMSAQELDKNALSILGTYAMLVYLTPVLGGWLADNYLGQRRSIIIGGVLMMLGQFTLGTPHEWVQGFELETMYLGLGLLILGNGFFKPNISTMVGDLYEAGDHRRDGAFTIFYMGINIGAFLAPFVIGTIGEKVDYQLGFVAAGVGMLIGLILQLTMARHYLGELGVQPAATLQDDKQTEESSGKGLTKEEFDRTKVVLILGFFTIIFWAGFEQAAGSMNLFAKNNTDLFIGGWEMPASWLQSVNAMFIVMFAPVFAVMWLRMGDNEPSSPVKFGWGLVLLGAGFLCMVGAAMQIGDDASLKASIWWLIAAYFLHTMGELCLSPVGLSMVTKLAPLRFLSLFMGIWFFFSGLANKVAHFVGGFVGEAGALATFGGVAIASIVSGLILFMMSNKLVYWMHGAEGGHHESKEQALAEEMSAAKEGP